MTTRNHKERRAANRPKSQHGYFLSLEVANVRCFGPTPQTLRLTDSTGQWARWTLLLGNNGVGKTTLLQTLAMEWLDTPWEEQHFAWVESIGRGDGITKIARRLGFNLDIDREGREPESGRGNPDNGHTLCLAYGATRRLGFTRRSLVENDAEQEIASLFDPDHELRNPEEWLLQLDHSASKRSKDAARIKRRYEQVRELLTGGLLPDVEDIRITEPTLERGPQVEFKTPYGWVSMKGVACGYQTLIAWIVDFARQMVEKYPESPDPLAEPAIVLIDEIDLHLHPSWQRQLMTFLSEKFPRTQFIASAHSPLIVQAAPTVNANVAVLRREGDSVVIDNHAESVRGWRIDQILASDLYSTPPLAPDVQKLVDERRRLLGKSRLSAADKRRIRTLEAEIGPLPIGQSPEEIRTAELLRRSLELPWQMGP